MVDDLAGDVDEPAPEGRGICGLGDDEIGDVGFERFKQRERQERHVVIGGVLPEALERQPLVDEVLVCPVDQLVKAAAMIALDNTGGVK